MRRGPALLIVSVIVVIAVVLLAGFWFLIGVHVGQSSSPLTPPVGPLPPASVTVQQFEIRPTSCLANATAPGGTVASGGTLLASAIVSNPTASETCEMSGVSSRTSGFSVTGGSGAFVLAPGKSESMSISVSTPMNQTDEPVVLSLQVTVLSG